MAKEVGDACTKGDVANGSDTNSDKNSSSDDMKRSLQTLRLNLGKRELVRTMEVFEAQGLGDEFEDAEEDEGVDGASG